MYKTLLHRMIWFPYRPEQPLIGPILSIVLLTLSFLVTLKGLEIFTVDIDLIKYKNEYLVALLLAAFCVIVCLLSAKADYVSPKHALFPCALTVILITAICYGLHRLSSDNLIEAIGHALIATLAALILINQFVQSGGPDLGAIGLIRGRIRRRVTRMKKSYDTPAFKTDRKDVVRDIEALEKLITDATPSLISPSSAQNCSKRLKEFLVRAKVTDDEDFRIEISEGPDCLAARLQKLA